MHDAMFPLLDLGERLHRELDAVFLSSPDGSMAELPSRQELKESWDEVNAALLARFTRLTAEQWSERHMAVSEEDFAKDPSRNRLAVLLSRTNHASFHLGQAILAETS